MTSTAVTRASCCARSVEDTKMQGAWSEDRASHRHQTVYRELSLTFHIVGRGEMRTKASRSHLEYAGLLALLAAASKPRRNTGYNGG